MSAMRIAYCIKCGNKFPEEANFCPYCGTKVYKSDNDISAPAEIEERDNMYLSEPEALEEPPIIPELQPTVETVDAELHENGSGASSYNQPGEEIKKETKPEATTDASTTDEEELEDPKIGVCILSFFFPIVGFIAAASNRRTNKKKSKTYAMWAWIGFGLNFISSILQSAI